MLFFILLFFFTNCFSYDWVEVGDFNEPVWKYFEYSDSGIEVVGTDGGLYLNTEGEWEYFPRGFRVYDIADLNNSNILLTDGSANCMSAGLWRFDFATGDYTNIFYTECGNNVIHHNNKYYYTVLECYYSIDGIEWDCCDLEDSVVVYSIAVYENYVVLATDTNVYVSEDEGITFNPVQPVISDFAEVVFNCDGVLFARTPYMNEESTVYISYDFGYTWEELFFGNHFGRLGVDPSGRLYVGWRGQPEGYSGIACWDEQNDSLIYLNNNLPNLEINRIQPYTINGYPSVICCTQQGLFYLTDFVSANNDMCVAEKPELSIYPNPFNPFTTISYSVSEDIATEIVIYNIRGQRVKELLNKVVDAGQHEITWNGKDESGNNVSSGIFFCRIVSGTKSVVKKMILLK